MDNPPKCEHYQRLLDCRKRYQGRLLADPVHMEWTGRLHMAVFGAVVMLGALTGIALALLNPPLLSSKVLVDVPASKQIQTQAVIAGSTPVLQGASRSYRALSFEQLLRQVKVGVSSSNLLAITVSAKTAGQAQDAADAVAQSYVNFVKSPGAASGQVMAKVVCSPGPGGCASPAMGTSRSVWLAELAGLGLLAGLALGVIVVVAIGQGERRLRERDEIAGAVGAPVLASVPVLHPSGTAGWVRLLEAYEPGVVHAWSLRKALRHVGVRDGRPGGAAVVLAVVSLSADRRALAIGPQLAVYAASLGVPTTLVIGPQQDPDVTAALVAACTTVAAGSRQPGSLKFVVGDYPEAARLAGGGLTVAVAVVDSRSPRLAAVPATATVLGVSAGAATAEQLARVALSLTSTGADISGIMVADPDPGDRTTGRQLQLGQPAGPRQPAQHKQVARLTGSTPENRR
jgi:capsular polysaccharide biosynthesis protein